MRLLVIALVFLSGCSHSMIAKDCVKADDNKFICKNLKPWE